MSNISREVIEKQLTDSTDDLISLVDLTNFSWLEGEAMTSFWELWESLVDYYRVSEDTEIGISTLREYVQFSRVVRRGLDDIESAPLIQQRGMAAIKEQLVRTSARLEYYVDEIVKEAERVINNQEDEAT